MNNHPRCLILGLGYTAMRFAESLLDDGWEVAGTTRSPEKAGMLRERGLTVHVDAPPDFARVTHLLASAAPGDAGDPFLAAYGAAIRAAPLKWAGYLSTTGVYGDRDGGSVDETSELRPSSRRSERRVAAEAAWLKATPTAHIFRLPGIYGPGRNALEQVRGGQARRILKPGHRFSRIHVVDIATVLRASMSRPRGGAIYNVTDDLPAESAEVLSFAAGLLGVAPPPAVRFADADLSPMARSFYADNKTVSNALIKQELGVRLAYPTYREGLQALAAAYSAG